MESLLQVASIGLVAGPPALLGALGVAALVRGTTAGTTVGLALLAAAALLPFRFGYGFGAGLMGAGLGSAGAAAWVAPKLTGRQRITPTTAVVAVVVVPLLTLTAAQVRADESFDRCAADKALAILAAARATEHEYPRQFHDLAMRDSGPYAGGCYVSNGVNWLYQSDATTYTIGYWIDWHVVRRVCLQSSSSNDWSCGFERWGPFRPGEIE